MFRIKNSPVWSGHVFEVKRILTHDSDRAHPGCKDRRSEKHRIVVARGGYAWCEAWVEPLTT